MHIGRTLPPAAAPISLQDIALGLRGILRGDKEIGRFESEIKQHFGVKHCFLVSSGKAAFTLILRALNELSPDRDEVLIPAFTCYSVPSSIVRAGLRVRLCDLARGGLDFDFSQLSTIVSKKSDSGTRREISGSESARAGRSDGGRASTAKTLAIVPTHLFGISANVERVRKIVPDSRVAIVEDAAQAMGQARGRQKIGAMGDVGFFSLGRGKAFSAVEGGVIVTNRDDLAERLASMVGALPRYGWSGLSKLAFKAAVLAIFLHPRFFWIPRSLPFLRLGETLFEPHFPLLRMSSFQAGLAANWRGKLEQLHVTRKRWVERWIAVTEADRSSRTFVGKSHSAGLLRFPLKIDDTEKRKSLLRESARRGLGLMPVYPAAINEIPELRGKIEIGGYPVAEECARDLVTLPTHSYVTEDDARKLSELISRVLGTTTLHDSSKAPLEQP